MKVAIGKVNAVSGKPWSQALSVEENDYLVCPPQPWLDGINAGSGFIRQFVAMPLGQGYTVEAQVTGKEDIGGIQLIVYEPKAGLFPDEPPPQRRYLGKPGIAYSMAMPSPAMGLGAGGKMKQKIYPDPHGIDTWDADNCGRIFVHIVNSEAYEQITGRRPPATPVSAQTYTQYGFPWFDLYDDHLGDLEASDILEKIQSVKSLDEAKGLPAQQDDAPVDVLDSNVTKYKPQDPAAKQGPLPVEDGEW